MSDGYFDDQGPGEHDAHLLDDDEGENDTTQCPRCDAQLLAIADRCYRCGATFGKEAWLAQGEGRWPRLWLAAAVLVLLAFGMWALIR